MDIDKLDFKPHGASLGGTQAHIFFDNGYGASVLTGDMFFTSSESPYELAVLEGSDKESSLTYDTPITDDVMGYLTVSEVQKTLDEIAALPVKES